jgi:cytochrome b6-f complex iron-sulfur subunit
VDSPPACAEPTQPTRRNVLDLLLGVTFFGAVAAALYPILRYLKPLPAAGPGGPVRLTRGEVDTLETKRFVIVPAAATRILVFRDQHHELRAFSARCTHEGCTVQYVPAQGDIWCACHNGRFNLDGRVISGPPPKPLPRYGIHEDAQGNVLVNTEST